MARALIKLSPRRRALAVPERALHLSIAQLFARAAPKHVMWWHTPNGEKRDLVTAAMLKRMGTVAGVPDFLLYDTQTGYLHCVEVKTVGGHLSDAQAGWKTRFDRSPTGRYAVARSLDDAILILQDWWPRQLQTGPSGMLVAGQFHRVGEPLPEKPAKDPQRKRVAGKTKGGR